MIVLTAAWSLAFSHVVGDLFVAIKSDELTNNRQLVGATRFAGVVVSWVMWPLH
jgi:hypothetical protein